MSVLVSSSLRGVSAFTRTYWRYLGNRIWIDWSLKWIFASVHLLFRVKHPFPSFRIAHSFIHSVSQPITHRQRGRVFRFYSVWPPLGTYLLTFYCFRVVFLFILWSNNLPGRCWTLGVFILCDPIKENASIGIRSAHRKETRISHKWWEQKLFRGEVYFYLPNDYQ